MGDLIWSSNPNYDTVDSLVAYLREYAAHCFAPTTIQWSFNAPAGLPVRNINAESRRQLFLVFKEALNNLEKHAQATRVEINLALTENQLRLVIADNGVGLPTETAPRFHHGLANMRQRISQLGGAFELRSQPGHGTQLEICIPFPS
jgi:signal transduction histidine kinase